MYRKSKKLSDLDLRRDPDCGGGIWRRLTAPSHLLPLLEVQSWHRNTSQHSLLHNRGWYLRERMFFTFNHYSTENPRFKLRFSIPGTMLKLSKHMRCINVYTRIKLQSSDVLFYGSTFNFTIWPVQSRYWNFVFKCPLKCPLSRVMVKLRLLTEHVYLPKEPISSTDMCKCPWQSLSIITINCPC